MADLGGCAAHIVMAVMVVGLFCVGKIVARDPEIAPTPPLQAGAGFALPVSWVVMFCSSVLVSFVAFVLQ